MLSLQNIKLSPIKPRRKLNKSFIIDEPEKIMTNIQRELAPDFIPGSQFCSFQCHLSISNYRNVAISSIYKASITLLQHFLEMSMIKSKV